MESLSFIPFQLGTDTDTVDTIGIRDDGQEPVGEEEALQSAIAALTTYQATRDDPSSNALTLRNQRDDARRALLTPFGATERTPWPKGSFAHIKAVPSAADINDARNLPLKGTPKFGDNGMQVVEAVWNTGALIACAVMVDHFEGSAFYDRRTGATYALPAFPPHNADDKVRRAAYGARIDALSYLPGSVIEFIAGEINSLDADPLARKRTDVASKNGSTPASTPGATNATGLALVPDGSDSTDTPSSSSSAN